MKCCVYSELNRGPVVQIYASQNTDSHTSSNTLSTCYGFPAASWRVALMMLPWIPRPVCRGSRGRPLRALAAVSDCWLMARPAEAEQPGCRCPLLRLEQGCSFWISPITVYPDVRRTPLLTDRHYSCFSLPAEKIIQLRPTQFLLRETLLWLTSVFAAHKV